VQIITFSNYADHITPMRLKLGIPLINDLLFRAISCDMYKIINKIGHSHNNILFQTVQSIRCTRSSSSYYLQLKPCKIKTLIGRNSFNFIGCKVWNFIPNIYKDINLGCDIFKNSIKNKVIWDKLIF